MVSPRSLLVSQLKLLHNENYITVICWSRDVVSRLIRNFYYVAARDVKIEKCAELWAIIEPR